MTKNMDEFIKDFLKKYLVAVLLILVFSSAFIIRSYSIKYDSFGELDCYNHVRMANYIVANGGLPEIDNMSYFPVGRRVLESYLPLVSWFEATSFKFTSGLGFETKLLKIAQAWAVALGAFAAIFLYLVGKELYNNKVGLIASAFYAFSLPAIMRSNAVFSDKESIAFPLIFLSMYFFVRGSKKDSIICGVLSGIFLGLAGLAWRGFFYLPLILIFFLLIQLFLPRQYGFLTYISTIISSALILSTYPYTRSSFLLSPIFGFSLLLAIGVIIFIALPKKYKEPKFALLVVFGIIFIGVVGIAVIKPSLLRSFESSAYQMAIGHLGIIRETVQESQPAHFFEGGSFFNGDWWRSLFASFFSMVIGLCLLGYYLIRYRFRPNEIFLAVWAFVGIYAAQHEVRLFALAAPVACVLTGFFFGEGINYAQEKIKSANESLKTERKKAFIKKRRKEKERGYWVLGSVLIVALITFVPYAQIGKAVGESNAPLLNPYWEEALYWIKNNTTKDSVIVSWWDYGFWFQAISERRTIVDGGNLYEERDEDVAQFFMSQNETDALKILDKYRDPKTGQGINYVLVSVEEGPKSWAIVHIGSKGKEDVWDSYFGIVDRKGTQPGMAGAGFFINNQSQIIGYTVYPYGVVDFYVFQQKGPNMILAKLLFFDGKNMTHFKQVFNNGYVKLYEIS